MTYSQQRRWEKRIARMQKVIQFFKSEQVKDFIIALPLVALAYIVYVLTMVGFGYETLTLQEMFKI
jgi:hypothetical protein